MAKKLNPVQIGTYYDALEKIFNLQADILSKSLPHYGERGRNQEEFLKAFLGRILPSKYSLATGFIVSPESNVSAQTDILICDEFHNAPIFRELAANMYPIESVYATIEVKTRLNKKELHKALEDIQRIRHMGSEKKYAKYGVGYIDNDKSKPVAVKESYHQSLPPRAYIFAFDSYGWFSLEKLKAEIEDALLNYKSFLHGVTILKKGWHFQQVPYLGGRVEMKFFRDKPLQRFASTLLYGLNSMKMAPMYADPYLRD